MALVNPDNLSAQESTYQREVEGHIAVIAPEASSHILEL